MLQKQPRCQSERRQPENSDNAPIEQQLTCISVPDEAGSQGNFTPPASSPAATTEDSVTYTEVVRAVHAAMAPIMEAHTSTLQQAVHDLKGQLTQLTQAVSANESRLGEAFQDVSDFKSQCETLQKSTTH